MFMQLNVNRKKINIQHELLKTKTQLLSIDRKKISWMWKNLSLNLEFSLGFKTRV